MIDNPALVLILGIAMGVLMSLTLGILIYAYWDLSRQFKKLFIEINDLIRGKDEL